MTLPSPARTATFLLTDIEGSTHPWEQQRAAIAGAAMTDFERGEYDAGIGRLHAVLDEDALGSAWAEGRAMTEDEAVAFALAR